MKNILITGGTGFIGHHIVRYFLKNTDFNFVSLDRVDLSSTIDRLYEVIKENDEWKDRVRIVWHDLKSPIGDVIAEKIGNVDYILHLAAGSHVNRSIKDPLGFVMDNVVGTVNLLEYARKYLKNLKLFLNFSTDEVFGPSPNDEKFEENDRHNPCNPYSASKSAAEQMCNSYFVTYDMPIIITHTMNVYGPRQNKEKFIPLVINRLLEGEKIQIHTDKNQTNSGSRCYLFADDAADAILFLLKNFTPGEKYNIASEYEVSNLEMAHLIARVMGKELDCEMVYPRDIRPGHDFKYSVSGEKVKQMGWRQKVSIEEGISRVVEWELNNNV